jgi:6-phosphogluconolactonase (cycloisomerase 2 family)
LLVVFGSVCPVGGGLFGAQGLDGATQAAVSPDGQHVYVASVDADAVVVFTREAATGILTFVEAELDGVDGVTGLDDPSWVVVSPDGAHVYAGGAYFTRDSGTGALTFVTTTGVGGREAALSPGGEHLYAAGANTVRVYARDAVTGTLTSVQTEVLWLAAAITVSPDGAHVYVGSDRRVVAFGRNAGTGSLTFIEEEWSFDFERTATGVTVSPDGMSVYATSASVDEALAVFLRNPATGTLAFVEVLSSISLTRVSGAMVSQDNSYLYVPVIRSVRVYTRDAVTGALTFLEEQRDEVDGVDGLYGANSVTLSPDGVHLYVTSGGDNKIVVFSRGPDGTLTLVDGQFGGVELLTGRRLLMRDSADNPEKRKGKWLAIDANVVAPERDFANDPRCSHSQPDGTVNGTIRFFSDGSGGSMQDTGQIPLPCQNWKSLGTDIPKGFTYKDKKLDDGPCKKVQVRNGKRLTATCLGRVLDFPYDRQVTTRTHLRSRLVIG